VSENAGAVAQITFPLELRRAKPTSLPACPLAKPTPERDMGETSREPDSNRLLGHDNDGIFLSFSTFFRSQPGLPRRSRTPSSREGCSEDRDLASRGREGEVVPSLRITLGRRAPATWRPRRGIRAGSWRPAETPGRGSPRGPARRGGPTRQGTPAHRSGRSRPTASGRLA